MAHGYQLWFDIVCQHEYFSDGLCAPLELRPNPACAALLQRYRLRFRAEPGGGAVYYDADDPLRLLADFDEPGPFTFELINRDAALLSYTADVPPPAPGDAPRCYYFDNLAGSAFVSDGADGLRAGESLLHAPRHPFGAGQLPLWPRRFLRRVPAGAALTVCASDGRQVWQADAAKGGEVQVDLGQLPEGRYQLRSAGAIDQDFYLSDAPFGARPWGLVAVHAQPRKSAAVYLLDQGGAPQRRHFRIAMASRRCIWSYLVVAHHKKDGAPQGQIVLNSKAGGPPPPAVQFTTANSTEEEAVDGLPATRYSSSVPLPLQEDGGTFGIMFRPAPLRGKDRKLPYARAASLVRTHGTARELRAEMYVYL
jgi:hypothetical protein